MRSLVLVDSISVMCHPGKAHTSGIHGVRLVISPIPIIGGGTRIRPGKRVPAPSQAEYQVIRQDVVDQSGAEGRPIATAGLTGPPDLVAAGQNISGGVRPAVPRREHWSVFVDNDHE